MYEGNNNNNVDDDKSNNNIEQRRSCGWHNLFVCVIHPSIRVITEEGNRAEQDKINSTPIT